MKYIFYFFILLFPGCKAEESDSLFKDLKGKAEVEIYLQNYQLLDVPADIGDLQGVRKLYIAKDSLRGWTMYPPLSALGGDEVSGRSGQLPDEITRLTSLRNLSLVNIGLVTLPEHLGRLQNLDTLILFMNKLTISSELEKLKQLKQLKYLGLLGNMVTADDLKQLKEAIPGVEINPDLR